MEINTECLIAQIFSCPALWDQKNKSYHNRIVVEKQWESVSAVLNQPKEQLKKKWKNIRDQFRNECKKIPVAKSGDPGISEAEYNTYTTWPHFKSLLFLKEQMKARKSSGNLKNVSVQEFVEESENWDEENNGACFGDFEVVNETPLKKKKKISPDGREQILAIEQRKLELLEKKINGKIERDDDQSFLDSLLPFMKKLDMNTKMRCRIDIQNTLYNYAFPSSGKSTPNIAMSSSSDCNSRYLIATPVASHPLRYTTITSPISSFSTEMDTNAVESAELQDVFNTQRSVRYLRESTNLAHFVTHIQPSFDVIPATETTEHIFPN